jgi:mannose-6-phosphate isomerase-like protein (cupin superfamily)
MILNKESVLAAKKEKTVVFFKNAFKTTPSWDDFYSIFKQSHEIGNADLSAPGTLTVDNSENYGDVFEEITESLSDKHPGKKIAVLSIVHFLNANDNTVPEGVESFQEAFMAANPNKLPPNFDFSLFQPTIHSDPVDGFYVQCEGSTTWRVYYEDTPETYLVTPGDALYIPKGVLHSVESLNVRAAISVSFYDED